MKIEHNYKDTGKDLKKSYTWKIQLTIVINFISSNDNDEKRKIHLKKDNIQIMINDKADEILDGVNLFDHFFLVIKVVISFLVMFIYCIIKVKK